MSPVLKNMYGNTNCRLVLVDGFLAVSRGFEQISNRAGMMCTQACTGEQQQSCDAIKEQQTPLRDFFMQPAAGG
eukprot:scaffold80098_cov20-Tisochrysis_lutea.AAC.1